MEKGGSQMSSREETQLEFYERLIRTHHKELLRLASIWLYQRANDAVDFGRAEEAVQETFTIAWEKREILMEHPNPIAWLNIALKMSLKTWFETIKNGQSACFGFRQNRFNQLQVRTWNWRELSHQKIWIY